MCTLAMKIYITGPPRSGKTTLLMNAHSKLNALNIYYMGFVTPEQRSGEGRKGFTLLFLPSKEEVELASIVQKPGYFMRHGKYWLNQSAGKEMASILMEAINNSKVRLIIIDEIGPMELAFEEFRNAIYEVITSPKHVVATFHISLSTKYPKLFNEIKKGVILDLRKINWNEAFSYLLKNIEEVGECGRENC